MEELSTILWSALGVIITTLITWASSRLIIWLNSKIKDEQVKKWATAIATIIEAAVKSVFQTYVDALKANGKFDDNAKIEAKNKAIAIIKSELTDELKTYIEANFGDMEAWISNQIESVIYNLKNYLN